MLLIEHSCPNPVMEPVCSHCVHIVLESTLARMLLIEHSCPNPVMEPVCSHCVHIVLERPNLRSRRAQPMWYLALQCCCRWRLQIQISVKNTKAKTAKISRCDCYGSHYASIVLWRAFCS